MSMHDFTSIVVQAMTASRPAEAPLALLVRHDRQFLQLTLERAAELAGLSVDQWRQLESGEWIPHYRQLAAIAQTLERRRDYLTMAMFWSQLRTDMRPQACS